MHSLTHLATPHFSIWLLFYFSAGILTQNETLPAVGAVFIFIPILISIFILKNRSGYRFFIFFLLVFGIGFAGARLHSTETDQPPLASTIDGVLVSDPKKSTAGYSAVLTLTNTSSTIRALFSDNTGKMLRYGMVLEMEGYPLTYSRWFNPGGFDYNQYLKTKGIASVYKVTSFKITGHKTLNPLKRLAIGLRNKLIKFHQKSLPHPHSEMLIGLIIGDAAISMPRQLKDLFKKTGLSHLLVVSGAQISLLSGLIFTILRSTGLSPRIQFIGISIANILFYFITGGGASILRAVIMAELMAATSLIQRRTHYLHGLALTGFIMLAIHPPLMFDIGAWLSFTATGSLVYGVPYFKRLLPSSWKPWIRESTAVAIAPFLWTAPLVAWISQTVYPISVISNLLVVSATEWLVILGFSVSIISFLFEPLAHLLNHACFISIEALLFLVSLLDKASSFTNWHIGKPSLNTVSLAYAFLIFLPSMTLKQIKWILGTILCVILVSECHPFKPLTVTFLDVGQGDSTLIQTPGGKSVLIDAGNIAPWDMGKTVVHPALKYYGINKLEAVITSHYDADHVGGIPFILSEMRTGLIIDNGRKNHHFLQYRHLISDRQGNHRVFHAGTVLHLDRHTRLEWLYPYASLPLSSDKNNASLVLKLTYKNMSVLLPADLENEGEHILLTNAKEKLNADILKCGHHGSITSTTPEFLSAVSPKLAVISCGTNNPFHHPHPNVTKTLKSNQIPILRTDKHGAIELKTNGKTLKIKTHKPPIKQWKINLQ